MSRVVVISGATGGMGYAIAKAFYASGCRLVLLGRSQDKLDRLQVEFKKNDVICQRINLKDTKTIDEALKITLDRFGRIDVFVNAAGFVKPGSLLEVEDKDWLEAIQCSLLGVMALVKQSATQMIRQKGGRIVLINGVLSLQPDPNLLINSTITGAINNFAKAISKDLGQLGVRVNVLNPGATDTPLWESLSKELADKHQVSQEDIMRQVEESSPLKRMIAAQEIAHMVEFLCSEPSNYLNGAFLTMDGGSSASF